MTPPYAFRLPDPSRQCHVGLAHSPATLDAEQRSSVDSASLSAVRALEGRASLKSRMAERALGNGLTAVGEGFSSRPAAGPSLSPPGGTPLRPT